MPTLNEVVCALYPGRTYNEALRLWCLANGATAGTLDEVMRQSTLAGDAAAFSGTQNERFFQLFSGETPPSGAPVITSSPPPPGQIGVAYSHNVTATGTGTLFFVVTSGSLGFDLTLNIFTGLIEGTPTGSPGTLTGTITVTNGVSPDATQNFSIVVAAAATVAPTITSAAPPAGQVDVEYSHTFTATGTTPITYSVTAGSLGADLTLSSAGVITGTPLSSTTLTGTITATNGTSPDSSQAFSITPAAAGVGAEYTLATMAARYTIPFSYSTPSLPSGLTNFETVSSAAEWSAAAGTSASEITIAPGTYGNIALSGVNDMDIIIQSGATVGTFSIDGCSRVRIRGETPRVGQFGYLYIGEFGSGAVTDLTIDGITQRHVAGVTSNQFSNFLNVERMSLLNSDLEAYNFVALGFATAAQPIQDIIIANCNLVDRNAEVDGVGNLEAAHRFQGIKRYVFVDNRLANRDGGGYQTLRLHAQMDDGAWSGDVEDVYIAGNQIEAASGTSGHSIQRVGEGGDAGAGRGEINNVWYVNNRDYFAFSGGSQINVGAAGAGPLRSPNNFTITGNQIYKGASDGGATYPSQPSGSTGWVVSNPGSLTYVAPPDWTFDSWAD